MRPEQTRTTERLRARILKEQELYEEKSHTDRIRLPRKMYFSSLNDQMRIQRRIAALKAAIEVNEKDLRDVDVRSAVLNSIPPQRPDFDELLEKAESIYLRERAAALKTVFEDILPICKKETIRQIENFLS